MAAAAPKTFLLSPENSPISGSPNAAKRIRRPVGAGLAKPALKRVLSDVANKQEGDIFSPTRTSPSKAPKRQVSEAEGETVELFYSRKYCVESAKVGYYLQQNGVKAATKRIADTDPIKPKEAIQLARSASTIYITEGETTTRYEPADLTDRKLKSLLISSKHKGLRAPAYLHNGALVIGFSEPVNEEVIFGDVAPPAPEQSTSAKRKKT